MAKFFSKENIQDASVGIICIVLKTACDLVRDAIVDFKDIQELFGGTEAPLHRLAEWIAEHGIPSDILVIALTIWVATAAKRGLQQGFLPAISILAIFLGWIAVAVCVKLGSPGEGIAGAGAPQKNLLLLAWIPCLITSIVLAFTIIVVKPAHDDQENPAHRLRML